MANPYHQHVEQWARQQRNFFHDNVDDMNHPMARMALKNIQNIEDAAQAGHNLRSIHDQIRTVERQMEQAKHAPNGYLSINHAVTMHHNFRSMGDTVRQHKDFNVR